MKKTFISLIIFLFISISISHAGIYFIENNGTVARLKGDTPFPTNAITSTFGDVFSVPESYLSIIENVVHVKNEDEIKLLKLNENLTASALTDRNLCLTNLVSLLQVFEIDMPIVPSLAMTQMFEYWSAHPENVSLIALVQQIQFLYNRLKIDYNLTDSQIAFLVEN